MSLLQGLLVVDLTRHLPGPYATQVLVDLGARVVKVEAPPAGDPVRAIPPHGPDGVSAAFRALNQGKESVAVDLKRPRGAELVRALAARADVLVEGFRPGVIDRLGLGPAALQAINPRLVFCSISGYGQDGPYRDRSGHDLNYEAYAGMVSINADRAGTPVTPGFQSGDLLAAFGALTGILAALVERQATGRGRVVDACMLDTLVSVQGLHLVGHLNGGRAVPGAMPLSGAFPCYRLYRCQDGGHVALAALEPRFWETFCDIVGRADWVERQHDPSLHPDVEALFVTRPRDEWRFILEGADCCLAPVLTYDEVPDDPQVAARGLVSTERTAPPVRFQGVPLPGPRPVAARPGEHGRTVCSELLGLDDAAIDGLVADGAVVLP